MVYYLKITCEFVDPRVKVQKKKLNVRLIKKALLVLK